MFCPYCRTVLPEGSKFCLRCGESMPAAPPVTARPQASANPQRPRETAERTAMAAPRAPMFAEPDPRSRLPAVIAAALLALLLVGGGGFWLLHRSQGSPGSVAAVPAPEPGDARSLGAPPAPELRTPAGPSVLGGPAGRGGPGVPSAVPGAHGPSVTAARPGRGPGGPAIIGEPPGPGGPGVTAARGGPRVGPPVTATPPGFRRGPSVLQTPNNPAATPSVAATPKSSAPSGPSVLKTPAVAPSGPPVAAQPPSPRVPAQPQGMPEDISRYLRFLQGVEAQRKRYEADLTNQALGVVPQLLMPNFDDQNVQPPGQQIARQYAMMAQQYAQATGRFQAMARQVRVPVACRRLHAYYSTALNLNPRLIMETAHRLAAGDYGGLLMMRGSSGRTIELNYQAADRELGAICNQYGIPQPFDIGNGAGSSDILLP